MSRCEQLETPEIVDGGPFLLVRFESGSFQPCTMYNNDRSRMLCAGNDVGIVSNELVQIHMASIRVDLAVCCLRDEYAYSLDI